MGTRDPDVSMMIRALIGSDRISSATKADLASYLNDLARGQLDLGDRNYVVALYRRSFPETNGASSDRNDERKRDEDSTQNPGTNETLSELSTDEWKARAYRTMERAKRAERQVQELEARVRQLEATGGTEAGGSEKFVRAKREFARMYHPDNVKGTSIEKLVRTEVFKEFWSVLEKIERPA